MNRINYTSLAHETIVLELPWEHGFVPPPQITIYAEAHGGHLPVVFYHRGDRPIKRQRGEPES